MADDCAAPGDPVGSSAVEQLQTSWEGRYPVDQLNISDDRRTATRVQTQQAAPAIVISTSVPLNSEVTIRVDATRHNDGDSAFLGVMLGEDATGTGRGQALHLFDGRLCQFGNVSEPLLADHAIARFQAPCGAAGWES